MRVELAALENNPFAHYHVCMYALAFGPVCAHYCLLIARH